VQKLIKCRSKCIRDREQGLNVAGPGAISMAFSFPCGGTGILWRILAKDFLSHSKDWGKKSITDINFNGIPVNAILRRL
jgi:hypothetical protein